MEGKAQTVTGPIDPAELGAVMMQEHLLIDLSGVNVPQSVAGPTGEHFWKEPCDSLEVSGGLRFCERPLPHPTSLTHCRGTPPPFSWPQAAVRLPDERAGLGHARHRRGNRGG